MTQGTSISTAIMSGVIANWLTRPDFRTIMRNTPRGDRSKTLKAHVIEVAAYATDLGPGKVSVIGTYDCIPCEHFPGVPAPSFELTVNPIRHLVRGEDGILHAITGMTCTGYTPELPIRGFQHTGRFLDLGGLLDFPKGPGYPVESVSECADKCGGPRYDTILYGLRQGSILGRPNPQPQNECNYICMDGQSVCGGEKRISLYATTSYPWAYRQVLAGWTILSCYQDRPSRLLRGKARTFDDLTPAYCANWCGKDYRYFGVEAGNQRHCGNELSPPEGEPDTEPQYRNMTMCAIRCQNNW
ncbi:hypothetical protein K402DRAFT_41395 [Aulographum hederae CBS 113979]|uniref:WSC domain-containing protein n=1 Tax=Aulographum hederae CBS 113979 TaxID=1176131 RepID=A0A6G1H4Y7_9PEZI|nr:hypothetical protein K402DRAFT_41395 [Aulographum hederae CBS 113979]